MTHQDHIRVRSMSEAPLGSTKGSRIVRLFTMESTEATECLPIQTKAQHAINLKLGHDFLCTIIVTTRMYCVHRMHVGILAAT